MLFHFLLRRAVQHGTLRLINAGGSGLRVGAGAPFVTLRLHRRKPGWAFARRPDLKIMQAYRDGSLSIEQGDLNDLHYILFLNFGTVGDLPRSVYGFGSVAACALFPGLAKTPHRLNRLLSARPWRKLFPLRKKGWLSFFRKRPEEMRIALSFDQCGTGGAKKADMAGSFNAQDILPRIHAAMPPRSYAALRRQQSGGGQWLAGRILLGPRPATLPWPRDPLVRRGRAFNNPSDNFVRQETS